MRSKGWIFVLAMLVAPRLASLAAPEPPRTIEAKTGKPRLDTRHGTPVHLGDRADYRLRTENDARAVPAESDPWSGLDGTRYGRIGDDDRRVTFAAREADDRWNVLVDTDGDGDLRDEKVLKSEFVGWSHLVRFRLKNPETPLALRLGRPEPEQEPRALLVTATLREGTIRIDGRRIEFVVQGDLGDYGDDWQGFFFDTDGDGELDLSVWSDERYVLDDGHVNLAGRSWSFRVSRDGSLLALEALDERRPDRMRLAPGNPAPDVDFTDIDGATGRLSDYRGRVLLLYLWGTWCVPCRGETPHVLEAYEKFHERGLEVLAVAKEDRPESVREYAAEYGIPWRQTIDKEDGPILGTYRAEMIPNLLLIDREGRIVERALRGTEVVARLEALFDEERR